ncbi:MAG: DUF4349 domain-containing protein [Thermoleophilia bacterium]|nr:DUF4349 domain-containing protein [Thermoleophilia bacterium]
MPVLIVVAVALLLVGSLFLGGPTRPAPKLRGTHTTTGSAGAIRAKPLVQPGGGGVAGDAFAARGAAADGATESGSSSTLATSTLAAPVLSASPSVLPQVEIDTRTVRSAGLQLRARRGDFEQAWGEAQAVAGAFGGLVTASSRSGSGKGPRSAQLTMRVPAARFDAAVAKLRAVGNVKVEGLDVASQDVGEEYVDTKSRLRHDRAVESRLLSLLASTRTVSEVLAVQARLDQVQEQIEVSTGRVRYLDQMTSMSTIDVTIRQPGAATGKSAGDHPSALSTAFHDATDRFTERVSGVVVWFGGALPGLLIIGIVLLTARYAWRRRAAG